MFHEQNGNTSLGDVVVTPLPAAIDHGALVDRLEARIVGQPEAVSAVARAVSIAHAGVADPGRPLASVLLVGPTGVGKTELVRRVAAEVRSGADDLCRIDMAALAQEHYAASFSGAPPGYAGSKESFTLFDKNRIEGDPYTPGVVLFDEVEKADSTVIRALLHVLDCGELRLANGKERISFRNCLVFLTSNLGSGDFAAAQRVRRRWRPWRAHRADSPRDLVIAAVEEFFDPEFFNRIDETVVMNPFETATALQVAALELELLVARLARESVALRVGPGVVERLHEIGFDPVYGARGLRRAIRTHLVAPVAQCVLRARGTSSSTPITLEASVTGEVLRVEPVIAL
ncbi:ATP-dependent Clp protease ATP-binding subunit [Mycolicibacterium arabiense]|nr:ATP-dependent Clp protease ATP-binding subunit [Mycolicibacterium arabiense]